MATARPGSVRRVHTCGRVPARDNILTRPPTRWSGLRRVPFVELGPDLPTPRLEDRFIAVGGALTRHLRRPVPALQEPGDMGLVVPGAECLPDDRGHPGAGPTRAPKAVGCCTVGSARWDHAPWVACACDRPCGARLGPPPLSAMRTHSGPPLADRRWGHTKRFGHLTRCPPVWLAFTRPLAARLLPGLGRSISSVHVRMGAPGNT
jgi:hypothetical protein